MAPSRVVLSHPEPFSLRIAIFQIHREIEYRSGQLIKHPEFFFKNQREYMRGLYATLIALLVLSSLSHGCKDPDDPDDNPTTPSSDYFFKAQVDGVTYRLQDLANNIAVGFGYEGTHAGLDGFYDFNTVFTDVNNNDLRSPQVVFKRYYFGPETVADGDFRSVFGTGDHDPWSPAQDSVPGILFEWRDGNGKWWSTALGPQDNWMFTVSESVAADGGWFVFQKVTGLMSCTLYDSTGNSLPVLNGEFVGKFAKP